jgi:cellulose synthase/poly-beta-1,6-N-acetylglucosamine synthase-like glycosyltransferase
MLSMSSIGLLAVSDGPPMNVSILVPAHNEARNITNLLESLLAQETHRARIIEIVVIASGCTDETAALARRVARGRPGIHVVVQERRAGKVAAINEYLNVRDKRADIVVCASADLCVAPDVVEKIVQRLEEQPHVGMVGARPVPDNESESRVGKMVHILWELHHRIALDTPKMGELVAFRAALVDRVSELSVVDEASVEDIVRGKGYDLAYVPDAIVTNHGPETLREYFEQRRRIARGHYWLGFAFGYKVATMHSGTLLKQTLDLLREQDREGRKALATAVGVEIAARAAGFVDARIVGGRHRTWRPLESTKTLRKDVPSTPKSVDALDDDEPAPESADLPRRRAAR